MKDESCISSCVYKLLQFQRRVDLNVFLSIKTQEVPSHKYVFNRVITTMVLLGALGSILHTAEKNKTHKMHISFLLAEDLEILLWKY